MTRKPLPKAIRRSPEDLRAFAGAGIDEEAPATPSVSRQDPGMPHAAAIRPEPLSAKRWSLARKIVERHKNYAALGGLVPIPIANIAGVTAVILRMVKQLSDLYGVPFERDRTRSLIIGIMGGAVPTGLGAATASTLAFAVPAGALAGLAVSAVTAAALTRGIGLVFIESFETSAAPLGMAEPQSA